MVIQLMVLIALLGYGPWSSVGPEGGDINAPVQSHSNPQELWATSGYNPTQVVHSTDGGETWESLSTFTGSTVNDMVICPNGNMVAAGSSRTWTSTNGGVTWTSHTATNTVFYDLAAHPTNSNVVYGSGYAYDGAWKLCFMHSTDGGSTFSNTFIPLGGSFTQSYGRAIAVSQSNPSVILLGGYGYSSTDATYVPFVFRSTNGGSSFTDVTPAAAASQYYFYGVGIHPTNPDIMLAGSLYSMYRSTDGGNNWTVAASSQTYNYDISFSEADPNLVLAAGTNRTYRSTNGGVSWTTVTSGLTGVTGIQWIIPDWSNSSNAFTASSAGFYKSTDSGSSWAEYIEGLNIGRVLAMEESQGWIFMNMQDMGVFKTPATGSVAWEEVNTPLSCGNFCDICADDSGVILALEGSG